ncbi:PDDEXK nuclease domain-containing protein [Legionella pneumophila]|uniref:PDDEXK nuclease domain-containing protein n=1 Tax=Legionella pneumophila TaxID=446 RepID=UPI003A4C70A9
MMVKKQLIHTHEQSFEDIVNLITSSKNKAYQAVNTLLIDLYWRIGEYISQKISHAEWGEGVVEQLASYIYRTQPGIRGFTRPNLFRMKQFYETYHKDQIVSPLVRQLPWTHNLIIINQSKSKEERDFYLHRCIQEQWSKRELERQFKSALYERSILSPIQISGALDQSHPEAKNSFKDAYMVEFLGLHDDHEEIDLHRALLAKLKNFLIELGKDFCFVGTEYPLQVGGRDFLIDLLFFHRGLNCLVAVELKVGRFEPEYLGKLSFYLEGLDRTVKKEHENPSIGLLLCASKDKEVVEFSLNRTLSPALIAEYKIQLPDKKLLQEKLHELLLDDE